MPLYEYQAENGRKQVAQRPVAERDKPLNVDGIEFRRVWHPGRISVVIGGGIQETQGKSVMAGYRKAEERMGSRFKSKFTADQIKNAWAEEL